MKAEEKEAWAQKQTTVIPNRSRRSIYTFQNKKKFNTK